MKTLLLVLIFASSLFSQTILCYKNNTTHSTLNENLKLNGDKCNGEFTLKQMRTKGWRLDDDKIIKNESSLYNHLYILKNDKPVKFSQMQQHKPKKINTLNLDTSSHKITKVQGDTITINQGNLTIGQSGVVLHTYANDNSIIIADAKVQNTSDNSTILILSKSKLLEQKALPTIKLKATTSDTLILNHSYNSSLLIAPNYETSQKIKTIYSNQNFINPDIFAAYLKINNIPVPTREDIQDFCIKNDIGTIFIAVEKQFYIIDTNSFQTLQTTAIRVSDRTIQVPFFTKVEKIERNRLKFWEFGHSKITDYNSYYLSLITNTIYQPQFVSNANYGKTTIKENEDKSIINKVKDTIKGWLPW